MNTCRLSVLDLSKCPRTYDKYHTHLYNWLFKAHDHSLFNFKNVLSMRIVQFHVATETPDCWGNFVKDVFGFCSSRLKSSTTSSATEGFPWDFLHLKCEPLTMFLQVINHSILAYKRSHNTQTLRLRSPTAITRHNNESVLFNRINHFHSFRFLAKNKIFVRNHQQFWKLLLCCFVLGSRRITLTDTWKTLKQ